MALSIEFRPGRMISVVVPTLLPADSWFGDSCCIEPWSLPMEFGNDSTPGNDDVEMLRE
jgi:hypothetical protein